MGAAALAPVLLQLTGLIYGLTALVTTGIFAAMAVQVALRQESDPRMGPEKRLFKYSVLYLFIIFAAIVVDHWVGYGVPVA